MVMEDNKKRLSMSLPEPGATSVTEQIPGEEFVRWAYRLLHGREPENEALLQNHPYKNSRELLLKAILASHEFRTRHGALLTDAFITMQNSASFSYESYDQDALAFIHIPKTGGTTLHHLLAEHFR